MSADEVRLLRLPEVCRIVGLRKSAVYERVKAGSFPAPIAVAGRARAWVSDDIRNWVAAQVRAAREAA